VLYRQGFVAQWTRARGYEPRSRGFESLLTRCHPEEILCLFRSLTDGIRRDFNAFSGKDNLLKNKVLRTVFSFI